MKYSIWFVAAIVGLLAASFDASASGGSSGNFRPTTSDPYNTGKAIYSGALKVKAEPDEALKAGQAHKLTWLQGKLPADQQKVVYLPELAGRLTEQQLKGLEAFIAKRFNVNVSEYKPEAK